MRVENARVERYRSFLMEKSRPPSRGGNTRAWHIHVMDIAGDSFSFRALGQKKWVFKADFSSEWDDKKRYRNISPETITVIDKAGSPIVRGNRGSKPWRSAEARMPVSRREMRD